MTKERVRVKASGLESVRRLKRRRRSEGSSGTWVGAEEEEGAEEGKGSTGEICGCCEYWAGATRRMVEDALRSTAGRDKMRTQRHWLQRESSQELSLGREHHDKRSPMLRTDGARGAVRASILSS